MKHLITLTLAIAITLFTQPILAQTCTALGDQTTYGTGDSWIGYVYDNMDLTNYKGYVNEGTTPNANFDESFGGDNVTYATNGCSINTTTFSVRYKLTKTFTNSNYTITVGGDDGYRLSFDGGATWAINKWADQSYNTTTLNIVLNGTYNIILDYYENGGGNRISFSSVAVCMGTENQTVYGTNNIWNGYVYSGMNFDTYKGLVYEGNSSNFAFDEKFGGNVVAYNTSACSITTELFSVRYKLIKSFASGTYTFVLGADDGYRLSLDGGATWAIDNWTAHSYAVTNYTVTLNGSYNMVLEYFERNGENRVNFSMLSGSVLPISLVSFTGQQVSTGLKLNWDVTRESDPVSFEIQKATDGVTFAKIATVAAITNQTDYTYTDASLTNGKSFYRMKMTDLMGKVIYSNVIGIRINSAAAESYNVYPTIVTNNSLYLESSVNSAKAIVTIVDAAGRTISQKNLGSLAKGQITTVETSATKLPAGMYFLQLNDGSDNITIKRFIVK